MHLLRTAGDLKGLTIKATDRDIGKVYDLYFDDESWAVRYFVVDARNWLPGRKVLVSPRWIDRVSWSTSKVYMDVSRDAMKNSPEYDKAMLSRDYETRLREHYGRSA